MSFSASAVTFSRAAGLTGKQKVQSSMHWPMGVLRALTEPGPVEGGERQRLVVHGVHWASEGVAGPLRESPGPLRESLGLRGSHWASEGVTGPLRESLSL